MPKTEGTSGPTKWTLIPQKKLTRKKKKFIMKKKCKSNMLISVSLHKVAVGKSAEILAT